MTAFANAVSWSRQTLDLLSWARDMTNVEVVCQVISSCNNVSLYNVPRGVSAREVGSAVIVILRSNFSHLQTIISEEQRK